MSVVVAARNERRFIGEAIRSVEMQTLRPTEIIVVDDGSTDDTLDVARDAWRGIVPVKWIRNERPRGPAAARNQAVAAASGEWIAICDGDDVWMPNKLERQFEFIDSWTQGNLAVLGSQGLHITEAGGDAGIFNPGLASLDAFHQAIAGGGVLMLGHSSVLYRRADHQAVGGYDSGFHGCEDSELWDRLVANIPDGVAVNVPEPLFMYRKKRGSMMQTAFWEQMYNFDRIIVNRRRRSHGAPPVTLEQFVAELRAQPLLVRMRRAQQWLAKYFYRFGAANMVNGHRVVGGVQLAIAGVLWPARLAAGLRNYRARG